MHSKRWSLVFLLLSACSTDALYSYCSSSTQCGTREYRCGRDCTYEVPLTCIEVQTDSTHGQMCNLPCVSDATCTAGGVTGKCLQFTGDSQSWCYQLCETDDDCFPSSACREVALDGFAGRVCLPTRLPGG